LAVSPLWEILDPEGGLGPLSASGAQVPGTTGVGSILMQTAVGMAMWATGILLTIDFGR
jgi:hypothetical protein